MRHKTLAGGFCALAIFILLGACAPAGSPLVTRLAGEPACMKGGEHCEFSDQCCSGRCYHETGCTGGTP
jgi:hypothetical protein